MIEVTEQELYRLLLGRTETEEIARIVSERIFAEETHWFGAEEEPGLALYIRQKTMDYVGKHTQRGRVLLIDAAQVNYIVFWSTGKMSRTAFVVRLTDNSVWFRGDASVRVLQDLGVLRSDRSRRSPPS